MLSIIMPVYNAERYLSEAIESILSQTYEDFEFIIINDGSTDNSQNIIEEYAANDKRIKCIQKENGGVAAALNTGLDMAIGEYIVRMDADDVSYPNRLGRLKGFMDEHPEIDICGSYALDNGTELHIAPVGDKMIKVYSMFNPPLIHPSVCFRKSFVEANSVRYDLVAAEDYDMWTRLLDVAKFANIPEPLLMYRIHGENITIKNDSQIINDDFRIKCDLYQRNGIINIPKHHYADKDFDSDDAYAFLDILDFFANKYNIQAPVFIDVERKIIVLSLKAEKNIYRAYRLYADRIKNVKGKVSFKMLCYFIAKYIQKRLIKDTDRE